MLLLDPPELEASLESDMAIENKNNTMNESVDSSILQLIYDDAGESLKALRTNIYNLNTTLALLIGFNATFATLLSRINGTLKLQLDIPRVAASAAYYPHGQQLYTNALYLINWLLLLKPIVAMLLISSILIAITALIPTPSSTIIYPSVMLELSEERKIEEFTRAVIENRDEVIKKALLKVNLKAERFKNALLILGIASVLLTFSIAIEAKGISSANLQ